MAVEEFVVAGDLQNAESGLTETTNLQKFETKRPGQKQWVGAATDAFMLDSQFFSGQVAIVHAESTAEAIRGYKQLFPGSYSGKCIAFKRSSATEE